MSGLFVKLDTVQGSETAPGDNGKKRRTSRKGCTKKYMAYDVYSDNKTGNLRIT